MANANGMIPVYASNSSVYSRPMPTQQCIPFDTKSIYHSAWTVPYSADTSPVDTYALDQSETYRSSPQSITDTNACESSYRWTRQAAKPLHHGTNALFDQESSYPTHNLRYIQSNHSTAINEPLSSLSASSLQLTLPERPRLLESHAPETIAPLRQLPIPQPNPAQNSRNTVDRLHDQRLRPKRAAGPITTSTVGSFVKEPFSWDTDGDNQTNMPDVSKAESQFNVASRRHSTTEDAMDYLPITTSLADDVKTASPTEQSQLDFSTLTLLKKATAPTLASPYSNFRECRDPASSSTQMARQGSLTDSYGFNSNYPSKRQSLSRESSNDCTLMNNHLYTPLTYLQPETPSNIDNLHHDLLDNRHISFHRSPISSLSNKF